LCKLQTTEVAKLMSSKNLVRIGEKLADVEEKLEQKLEEKLAQETLKGMFVTEM